MVSSSLKVEDTRLRTVTRIFSLSPTIGKVLCRMLWGMQNWKFTAVRKFAIQSRG